LVEGTPFGPYRLIALLGRGGMGEVWRAYDTTTSRIVAVKVLTAQLASDPTYEQRFRREALAAAGLNEPHVVPIHKFGEIDGRLYVDMRLIEGQDLDQLLARGPLPPHRAVHIVEQIAAALHAAHRIGLVHRDVKPSNILVAEDDFAYLIDFGIARSIHETGLTSTGAAIGTLAYMAPERFSDGNADARSDVYALACVLYQALTGYQPYPGNSFEQLLAGHLMTPPPQPSMTANTVPTTMDRVIAAGMAKNPDERYPSTRDLARAARGALTSPIPNPPPSYAPPPQHGTQIAPQHHPTQFAPTQQQHTQFAPAPAPPAKPGRSKTKLLWAGIAATLTVIALVAVLAITLTGHDNTNTATTPTSSPPTDVPLTGTFKADFGPQTDVGGKPQGDAPAASETWTFRSACPTGGCVATASAGGPITETPSWVFDEVNGQWVAVSVAPGKCQNLDAEIWHVIRLKKAADGSFTGQYSSAANVGCTSVRSLTIARTGDGDVNKLADPATLPARVPSPGEPLYGLYHQTLAFSPRDTFHYNYTAQTSCLRAGDRCATVLSDTDADQVRVWIFAAGKWTQYNDYSGICPGVGLNHFRDTAEFPLPQPAQDPITSVTGQGNRQVPDGGLCVRGDFTSTLQRTGD
jgi:serine/threonine-protein kinase